jgi:hypothetical protein
MAYRSLIVEAELGSPVVGDPTIPLDGILLFHVMARKFGPPRAMRPGEAVEYDPAIVPLQIVNPGREWFYACSFAQWSEYIENRAYWNKRFDIQHNNVLASGRKIDSSSGPYKSYHMPIYYRAARYVRWYCVGDIDAIGHLLSDCIAIGKKRSIGWGYIHTWHIFPAEHDYSIFDSDGQLTRAIPSSYYAQAIRDSGLDSTLRDIRFGNRGFRPPYWARENQTKVAL